MLIETIELCCAVIYVLVVALITGRFITQTSRGLYHSVHMLLNKSNSQGRDNEWYCNFTEGLRWYTMIISAMSNRLSITLRVSSEGKLPDSNPQPYNVYLYRCGWVGKESSMVAWMTMAVTVVWWFERSVESTGWTGGATSLKWTDLLSS